MRLARRVALRAPQGRAVVPAAGLRHDAEAAVIVGLDEEQSAAHRLGEKGDRLFERGAARSFPHAAIHRLDGEWPLAPRWREKIKRDLDVRVFDAERRGG